MAQIEQNTADISSLSKEIAGLKENGTNTGSGVTTAQANSLWTVLQKAAFVEALTDEELDSFKTAWVITDESGGEEPDIPIEPEQPEVGIVQTGSILSISSDVTATQTDTILVIV